MHRPDRSPSQRYRFEQYFDYLEENGLQCHLSYLINAADDQKLYLTGHYLAKLRIFLKSWLARLMDLRRINYYDFIFIQREAFMTGNTYFEKRLAKSGKPLIYDFDDAIWLLDENDANRRLAFLKNPGKIAKIIALSDQVVAGNNFLAEYAQQYNSNVTIIPTTIDTNRYVPVEKPASKKVVIGWTGSFSTIKHFEDILPVLSQLKEKYGNKLSFEVIGDANYINETLGITGRKWQSATETDDLARFDIGIMPLPDNEWTRGKCGAKGLQYMGMGIATVMSPVGVNTEIIEDGVNGFLAATNNEWFDKLSRLIEQPDLRQKLGKAGRQTVENNYSVEANKYKYLALFRDLQNSSRN